MHMPVNTAVRAVVRSPGKATFPGVVLADRFVHFLYFNSLPPTAAPGSSRVDTQFHMFSSRAPCDFSVVLLFLKERTKLDFKNCDFRK